MKDRPEGLEHRFLLSVRWWFFSVVVDPAGRKAASEIWCAVFTERLVGSQGYEIYGMIDRNQATRPLQMCNVYVGLTIM